jgi:hypothetical protein
MFHRERACLMRRDICEQKEQRKMDCGTIA